MKKINLILFSACLFLVTSCGEGKPKQKLEDLIPSKYMNAPTIIAFEEVEFDFGNIKQGDVVKHVFKFKNAGKNDLIIVNGFGSCGCTVPTYPKEPIHPGQSSEILVQFNSENKAGAQNKKVFLIANTAEAKTELSIKANVIAK